MFKVEKKGINRLDIEISGKLDSDTMRSFIDEYMGKLKDIESGRILLRVNELNFPTLGAIGIKLSHLPDLFRAIKKIDKVAVLTEKKWLKKISEMEGKLIPGLKIKAFDREQAETAEAWLIDQPDQDHRR